MKEKAASLVGTIVGIGGYLILKEWYVNLGFKSFLASLLACLTLALVLVGVVVLSKALGLIKPDKHNAKEKPLQNKNAKEDGRK